MSACRASRACREDDECFFNADEKECDAGDEHLSSTAMSAGIAVAVIGSVAAIAGGVLAASSVCFTDCGDAYSTRGTAGVIMLGAGLGVAAIVGGPMAIVGSIPVAREPRDILVPAVAVSPTDGSMTWQW